jgi:acylphosphatase
MDSRVNVLFEGRVQGVGFRLTAVHVASRFKVSGFVQNLPDGDVLVVAEGERAELDRFLAAIRTSQVGRFIHHERVSWPPATGEFQGFDVRYH